VIIRETAIAGVHIVEPERREDSRGFFARTWCADEFTRHGLDPRIAQCSMSFNHRRGTLRGMHYQAPPHAEAKLVRCTRGAIWDVALDLRPESATFLRHLGVELSGTSRLALYLPEGVAHGFQTLMDDSEVFYQMSVAHEPSAARGVRFDDPAFDIEWPVAGPIVLERDRSYPDFPMARAV
jgi:dTDP-4-dehydrorhamnose 3,5-epimerase